MSQIQGSKAARTLSGRKVLAFFIGAFLVVIAVNATFVTLALKSWSGLSVEKPYDRGIKYNQVLDIDRAEMLLGWKAAAAYDGRAVTVSLADRNGNPVDGAIVDVVLARPTSEGHDQSVSLAPIGGGRYAAEARVALPGQWDLKVAAVRGADHFHWRARVFVTDGAAVAEGAAP